MRYTLHKLMGWLAVFNLVLVSCNLGYKPAEPTVKPPKVTNSGFACAEPEPRLEIASTELNLLVWTEYFPPDMLECFELVYGVKINRVEYSSNEEMVETLASASAAYDLVQPSDYFVERMIRQERLQKLDHARLPNLTNIDSNYLDLEFDPGNVYTIPYAAGSIAIVYNAEKVAPPPDSWADLWDRQFEGRLVFLDDARNMIAVALLTLGYDPNTTDAGELEEARVRLAEVFPRIREFNSDSPKSSLVAGDSDMGIVWTGEAFVANQILSAIQYAYPIEGAIFWQDNWAIPINARHADAAYAFLNYLMQGDVFWMMLDEFPYTNPNKAALEFARQNHPDIYQPYIDSIITNPPSSVIAKGHHIVDVGDAAALYEQIWNELRNP